MTSRVICYTLFRNLKIRKMIKIKIIIIIIIIIIMI